MKSNAKTVEEYINEVSTPRKKSFLKLRDLCRKHLPDHKESMAYGMPSYIRNKQVEVAVASQKQYLSVYFLIHEVMLNNQDRLSGLNYGKGCIRFANPDKIDFDLIEFLLKETKKSDSTIC